MSIIEKIEDFASLDEYDKSVAEALVAKYPDWIEYLEIVADKEETYVHFKIPQPNGDKYLEVSTADGEITVIFGRWHDHMKEQGRAEIDEAIQELEDFLNERTKIIFQFDGDTWKGSLWKPVEYKVKPTFVRKQFVYSWLGTYDEIVDKLPPSDEQ